MSRATQEQRETLEGILDAIGLEGILDAIGDVCAAKAEHVATNWQDAGLAKAWEREATRIDALLPKIDGRL